MSLFDTQNYHRKSPSLGALGPGKLTQDKVSCVPAEQDGSTGSRSSQYLTGASE